MIDFRKIPLWMVVAVFLYIVAVGCLLFVTFSWPTERRLETVKVNITDFQPPRLREVPEEQSKKLAEVEAAARELREQATKVDEKELKEDIRKTVDSFDAAAELKIDPIEITPSNDAKEAEDAELLASLEGIGPANIPKGSGGGAGAIGPPGMRRGASLKTRLSKNRRGYYLKAHGGNKKTETAVEKALKYLAAQQSDQGCWGGHASFETGDFVALTSLSLLAFLGHGEHYGSEYGDNLTRGINYLLSVAQTKGVERAGKGFGHAIMTYALAEAYSITGDIRIKPILQERVLAILRNQNSMGSFSLDYDNSPVAAEHTTQALQEMSEAERNLARQIIVGEPECDLSLLGWHVQALTAAKVAGIEVDGLDEALKSATAALVQIHQAKSGGFSQGINAKRFEADNTLTPVGLLGLQLLGYGNSKAALRSRKVIAGKDKLPPIPKWNAGGDRSFPLYRWYYQTQAVFQTTKSKGKLWQYWNENLKKEFTSSQQKDGSWCRGGGIDSFRLKDRKDLATYSTAMAALMLEVYYRYLPGYSIREAPRKSQSLAERLDAAKLGLLKRMEIGIDPEAAILLGAGIRKIRPIQFGEFDGKPSQPNQPHQKFEFKTYASLASTIGVHKADELPQLLQPNQRIAFFLDDLLPDGFKWHLQLTMAVSFDPKEECKTYVPFQVVINGKTIHNSYLHSPHQLVNVLIPADLLNSFGNVLEVRNSGDIPLCFDAASLESVTGEGRKLFLAAKDADELPKDSQYLFNIGVIDIEIPKEFVAISNDELKQIIAYQPEAENLYERMRGLWMLRKNIDNLQKIEPELAENMKKVSLRLRKLMVAKIEPLICLDNISNAEQIRPIASLLGPFVKYWQLDGTKAKDAETILREYCSDAYVLNQTDAGTARIFNQPRFAEYRQALSSLMATGGYNPGEKYWGGWEAIGSEEMGQKFQKYYLCKEGRGIIEWVSGGGCGVIWSDVLTGGKFYDSLYKTPLPALASLRQTGRLFEGAPQILPSGFYPAVGEKPLLFASSAASLNAPGIATVIAARRFPTQRELEVTAVVPWSGKTEVTIETGYLPKDSPFAGMAESIKSKTETVEVKNNLFRYRGTWPEMAVFRLVKRGDHDLRGNAPRIQWAKSSVKIDVDRKSASREEPAPDMAKKSARNPDGFFSTTGSNCSVKVIPSSISSDSKRRDALVPGESKSPLITFLFEENGRKNKFGSNAFFSIKPSPLGAELFGFMVLPRIDQKKIKGVEKAEVVRLQFALGDKIFQLPLKLNLWNYVTVPLTCFENKNWNTIRIMTPPVIAGTKVLTYELNDMGYFNKTGICYSESKKFSSGKEIQIALLGKPGSKGEYRLRPYNGWSFINLSCEGVKDFELPHFEKGVIAPPEVNAPMLKVATSKPTKKKVKNKKEPTKPPSESRATINKTSGELELFVKFPDKMTDAITAEIIKKLSGKARYQMKTNDLIPVIITAYQEQR